MTAGDGGFASLLELARWRARQDHGKIGYTFLEAASGVATDLTYDELDLKARRIAVALKGMTSPEDRVLLIFPQGLEFIASFFGCVYAGLVSVPTPLPAVAQAAKALPRFRSLLKDARPAAILTTTEAFARLRPLVDGIQDMSSVRWIFSDRLPGAANGGERLWSPPRLNEDSVAFLQYTSGSTSEPKGVVVTHGNVLHNEEAQRARFLTDGTSVSVSWLPQFHDMGLISDLMQAVYSGSRCVYMDPLAFLQRPYRWLEAISRYRGTISGAPNFAYDLCVRKVTEEQKRTLDLSSWRFAINAAEPIRAATLGRFIEAFAGCGLAPESFFCGYGLAESTLMVSVKELGGRTTQLALSPEALGRNEAVLEPGSDRVIVSCGSVTGGQSVRIICPETLASRRDGAIGEIWISGPSVARGYWDKPELSSQIFGARTAEGEGPFLRTGDLGFLAAGELYITGRRKDLIVIHGHNHYPQDLEATVTETHPALRPGCCIAFSIEEDDTEKVVVAVEIDRAKLLDSSLDQLRIAIQQRVAESHQIELHRLEFLAQGGVPKTSSGKLRRSMCREIYRTGGLERLLEAMDDVKKRS